MTYFTYQVKIPILLTFEAEVIDDIKDLLEAYDKEHRQAGGWIWYHQNPEYQRGQPVHLLLLAWFFAEPLVESRVTCLGQELFERFLAGLAIAGSSYTIGEVVILEALALEFLQ